ncbi:hypothetical protein JB92DRAFT_1872690 [Gautieria morchelliformis]|nr:hypothetical protein JB92DRAFT_1872690 [Gautieria morchelliformis]
MADDLVYTTALLLIANPTHNTALNRRKQLIRMQPSNLTADEDIKFIAALFGSKEASKSSVLWHHRRWLFRHLYPMFPPQTDPTQCDSDSLEDMHIPIDVLRSEFTLAARASEIYPRNYYAWLHRYLCAQCLISRVKGGVSGALEVLFQEVEDSREWMELHVSDYTAAQYLFRLLIMLRSLSISVPLPPPSFPSDLFPSFAASISTAYDYSMASNALSLVASYPTHESLWLYLRLSCGALQEQNDSATRWIVDLVLTLTQGNHPKHGQHALVQKVYSSCRTDDIPTMRKYALYFLVWTTLLQRDGLPDDVIPHILTDAESTVTYLAELFG